MGARGQGSDPTGISPAREQRNEGRREQESEHAGEEQRAVDDEHDVAISAERREAGRQQQDDKSQRDQQPYSYAPIDHHAHHRVAPIAAETNDEPGTHPVSRHARQDLSKEDAHSGGCDHGGARHPPIERVQARRECCANAPPRAGFAASPTKWRMRPSENPTARRRTRPGSNRFAARHTKSRRRSREAWSRRAQFFRARRRRGGLTRVDLSGDIGIHSKLRIFRMAFRVTRAMHAPAEWSWPRTTASSSVKSPKPRRGQEARSGASGRKTRPEQREPFVEIGDHFVRPALPHPPCAVRGPTRIRKPIPAAAPASTSLIWSPTIAERARSRPRSDAACRIIPGLGLRQG